MRRALLTALITVLSGAAALGLAVAPAAANPDARRKTSPASVTRAASDTFSDAVEADQKGDLQRALGLYQKAFEIAPHPSTIYNTADVQRRLGKLSAAIRSYEIYLALAPTAPDRKDVEALVAQLARTPGTLLITSNESHARSIPLKRAYILIDGEIRVKPGAEPKVVAGSSHPAIEIEVRGGKHVIDAVTSIGYASDECEVRPGERAECHMVAPPRSDGALVISGTSHLTNVTTERERSSKPRPKDRMHSRFDLPAGRSRLHVRDAMFECPALAVDVPSNGDVLYAFLGTREPDRMPRCRTLAIKQHRLRFER